MSALDDQARFLTAKYGTAAGPTGFPIHQTQPLFTLNLASVMIVLGFLIFLTLLFILIRDAYAARRERSLNERTLANLRT